MNFSASQLVNNTVVMIQRKIVHECNQHHVTSNKIHSNTSTFYNKNDPGRVPKTANPAVCISLLEPEFPSLPLEPKPPPPEPNPPPEPCLFVFKNNLHTPYH